MNKPKVNKDLKLPQNFDELMIGGGNGVGVLATVNSGFRTFHPVFDYNKCVRCMFCWIYCPEGCIDKTTVDPESGKIMLEVDMDYCKGCGICTNECPTKCITMVKDGDDDE